MKKVSDPSVINGETRRNWKFTGGTDIESYLYFNKGDFDGEGTVICSHFGCGRPLTLPEQLSGHKCQSCRSKVKADPTFYVSHPSKKSA